MARPHASKATADRNRFFSTCFDRAQHATHNGQTRKSEVGVVVVVVDVVVVVVVVVPSGKSEVGSRKAAAAAPPRGDDDDGFRADERAVVLGS